MKPKVYQLKLRMPEEVHARMVERASSHGRSLNAEIVAMLETALLRERTVEEILREYPLRRVAAITGGPAYRDYLQRGGFRE